MTIAVDVPGFALTEAGPFTVVADQSALAVVIDVDTGFDNHIRVQDDDGNAVANAEVRVAYQGDFWTRVLRQTSYRTSGESDVIIPHCTRDFDAVIDVRVPGFQPKSMTVRLKPDTLQTVRLVRGQSIKGRVVSAVTNRPIANAEIVLVMQPNAVSCWDPRSFWGYDSRDGLEVWHADESGRFTIDTLSDVGAYAFLIQASGHRPHYLGDVKPGRHDVHVELAEPLEVSGVIYGTSDQLYPCGGTIKTGITCSNPLPPQSFESTAFLRRIVPLDVVDGRAEFTLTNLVPGPLLIGTLTQQVHLDLSHSLRGFEIHLDADASPLLRVDTLGDNQFCARHRVTRRVTLNVHPPPGHSLPTGKMYVDTMNHYARRLERGTHPIVDGVVSVDVDLITGLDTVFGYGTAELSGLWIPPAKNIKLPHGDWPFIVDVQCYPAGAVYGDVCRPPAATSHRPEFWWIPESWPSSVGTIPSQNERKADHAQGGRFVFRDLPLDGVYRIVATLRRGQSLESERQSPDFVEFDRKWASAMVVVSNPIRLTNTSPIHEMDVEFEPGVGLRGHVVKSDGTPYSGAVITVNFRPASVDYIRLLHRIADNEGRFELPAVNDGLIERYSLDIGTRDGTVLQTVALDTHALMTAPLVIVVRD